MRVWLILIGAMLVSASEGRAELRWLAGGGPPFAFVADVNGGGQRGDTLSILVQLGARYPTSARASVSISVPRELGLVRGDTLMSGALQDVRGRWTLLLLPQQTGRYELRGKLAIEAGTQGVDEAEFTMQVNVGAESVTVEHSRYVRLESRRDGQRFRYADWWLVPLDSTEMPVVQSEIEARGVRARVLAQTSARCDRCPAAATLDSVHFVVAISPDGRVRDWKVLGSSIRRGRPTSEMTAAAEIALKQCLFRAAQKDGQAVSDWVYVSIPVQQR
jgi:hypothetical protein